jgi:hypothetical protein
MRHFLLALLIALLPLRGWMGDAMALALVTHPDTVHSAVHAAAPPCAEHGAATEASHQGHNAVADLAHEHPASGLQGDNVHQHKVCDVCNGPALALSILNPLTQYQQHSLQANQVVRFASTVLPKGIKPPIS